MLSQYCTEMCLSCRVDPVGPKEEAKARVELKPTTEGTYMLVAKFKSDKLFNIHNSLNIDVKPLPLAD